MSSASLKTFTPPSNMTSDLSICSVLVSLCHTPPIYNLTLPIEGDGSTLSTTIKLTSGSICNWICLDDVCGSFCSWSKYGHSSSVQWNFIKFFTTENTTQLFRTLHLAAPVHVIHEVFDGKFMDFINSKHIYGVGAIIIPYTCSALPS